AWPLPATTWNVSAGRPCAAPPAAAASSSSAAARSTWVRMWWVIAVSTSVSPGDDECVDVDARMAVRAVHGDRDAVGAIFRPRPHVHDPAGRRCAVQADAAELVPVGAHARG